MRKTGILVPMLVLAALLLAACGGASSANQTPTAGAPAAGATTAATVPAAGATMAATAAQTAAQPAANSTATANGAQPAGTPTAASTTAAAPAANQTGTPSANVPVTGNNGQALTCNPNLLSDFVNNETVDINSQEAGTIQGAVILRDVNVVPAGAQSVTGNTGAGNTTTGTATASPAGTATVNIPPMAQGRFTAPQIAYMIVRLGKSSANASARTVLVPFGAFKMAPGQVNDKNSSDLNCGLVLNVSNTMLSDAPAFDVNKQPDFNVPTWDQTYVNYWSKQGVAKSNTNPALGSPVVLQSGFAPVVAQDWQGNRVGTIQDFVINPSTGAFQYALLQAGDFLGLGSKVIPVPSTYAAWVAGNSGTPNDAGYMLINLPKNVWQNAPAFNSIDAMKTNTPGWDSQVAAYWNTVK